MLKKVGDWFDERTGYRALVSMRSTRRSRPARAGRTCSAAVCSRFHLPGRDRPAAMSTYTPSDERRLVQRIYIQYKLTDGWFVRGLHSFGAQSMIVVLGMHLLQVALYGA